MSTEPSRTITKRELAERLSERTGGTVEDSLGRIESLLAMRSFHRIARRKLDRRSVVISDGSKLTLYAVGVGGPSLGPACNPLCWAPDREQPRRLVKEGKIKVRGRIALEREPNKMIDWRKKYWADNGLGLSLS